MLAPSAAPSPPSAADPLRDWVLRRGLVLVNQIQEWSRGDEPRIAPVLAREHSALHAARWLDAVADEPSFAPPLPLAPEFRPPRAASSALGRGLIAAQTALIVQDEPFVVVGLLDPFSERAVLDEVFGAFPSIDNRAVCLTPSDFHRTAGAALCGESAPVRRAFALDPWRAQLGLSAANPLELFSALWANAPSIPVISAEAAGGDLLPVPNDESFIFALSPRRAWVVAPNPLRPELVERVLQHTGRQACLCSCPPEDFARLAERAAAAAAPDGGTKLTLSGPLAVNDWGAYASMGELLTRIVAAAIAMGASDIHWEPKAAQVRVRFRIAGALRSQAPLSLPVYGELVRDIKVTKGMNQLVRGHPQDGHGHVIHRGVRYDQRYSILPVEGGGETTVCRIFDSQVRALADLPLGIEGMQAIRWALAQETGMIVLTGPTGSGKTSTLYALLRELSEPTAKLFTLEDPVERHFDDAVQLGVHAEAGFTFDRALRHILRQDPDVILVGELRDAESATVAVNAAMTGHKVLTTTHANDAPGAVLRLTESFGIDPVALSLSLRLSIAQRLIPRLCPYCRTTRPPEAADLEFFPPVSVAAPGIGVAPGCPACRHTGVLGRVMVAEVLAVDGVVAEMIAHRRSPADIKRYAGQHGWKGLDRQATELMLNGEISLRDASRFLRTPAI